MARIWREVEDVLRPDSMNTLAIHIKERIMCTMVRLTDYNIGKTFVKCGSGQGWYASSLYDYDVESSTLFADTTFSGAVVR